SFTSLFGNRWRQFTEKNIEEADEAISELEQLQQQTKDEQLIKKIHRDLERLRYAQNYYAWIMKFIHVIESGKIFDYIPNDERLRSTSTILPLFEKQSEKHL